MYLHRSQTISPAGKDIEYRVTRRQPHEQVGKEMKPKGEPYPVVELYRRDPSDGELNLMATFTMTQFKALSREVVNVGLELVPAKAADVD